MTVGGVYCIITIPTNSTSLVLRCLASSGVDLQIGSVPCCCLATDKVKSGIK